MSRVAIPAAAALLVAAMLANGLFMTVAPEGWYWAVPGVPDRGPFNQHFVRDIGILYLLMAGSFALGLAAPAQRLVLWGWPTLWLAGHGLFHLWEVAVGLCGPEALAEDFPGVMLPALIGAALTLSARRAPG